MITNDQEYENTFEMIAEFKRSLEEIATLSAQADSVEPWVLEAEAAQISGIIEDLRIQLAEYDALKSGQSRKFEVDSLAGLLKSLIKVRIASGVSQEDIAVRLGRSLEQIELYESMDYQVASIADILGIATVLKINIKASILLTSDEQLNLYRSETTSMSLSNSPKAARDAARDPYDLQTTLGTLYPRVEAIRPYVVKVPEAPSNYKLTYSAASSTFDAPQPTYNGVNNGTTIYH